ncbi:uncharacterized protein Dwil_GK21911 [Drosophila willistoni]|uniref:uncharacterized protein LOC6640214 n=1 Tax=Drosophila willistoni TaxID=7260 RepID=UPI0007328605|nr:uncharacterized protein LOC6640214 [Drosophila willistoni]EDW74425.2 uncharacterized protein Dwil_GK21911 [Drosophila willistoni]
MFSSVLIILCSAITWQVNCDPPVIYKTKNIECFTIPKFSANASCYVKAINWNKATAHMDVDLVETLYNISIRLQIFKRDYTNKFQPWLVDVPINICDVIARRNFLPYGTIIWKSVKRFSNFNHSCPFMGHLFARDVYMDESYLPIQMPLGLYQFSISIYENYQRKSTDYVGAIKFYAQAMEPVKSRRNQSSTNRPNK